MVALQGAFLRSLGGIYSHGGSLVVARQCDVGWRSTVRVEWADVPCGGVEDSSPG